MKNLLIILTLFLSYSIDAQDIKDYNSVFDQQIFEYNKYFHACYDENNLPDGDKLNEIYEDSCNGKLNFYVLTNKIIINYCDNSKRTLMDVKFITSLVDYNITYYVYNAKDSINNYRIILVNNKFENITEKLINNTKFELSITNLGTTTVEVFR